MVTGCSLGAAIIPAYAGSTGGLRLRLRIWGDHPRIRGEHGRSSLAAPVEAGSSPHTRGAHTSIRSIAARTGIIPAYAGSTRPTRWMGGRWRDHPRIRGEHVRFGDFCLRDRGSSPHTRGALYGVAGVVEDARIIPAYAGSTFVLVISVSGIGDHPRIRGEHTYANMEQESILGSSPHTRGARRCRYAPC